MSDPFDGQATIFSSAEKWVAITPDDNVPLTNVPKGIWADVAGYIAMKGKDDVSAIFLVPAGVVLPFRPTRILSTGTTATGIKAVS